jgi:hypothetical protein
LLVGCFVVVTLLRGKLKLGLFGIVSRTAEDAGAARRAAVTASTT